MTEETWIGKDLDPIPICPEQDGYRDEGAYGVNFPESLQRQLAYQSCQRAMDVEVYQAKREIDSAYNERKNRHKADQILKMDMVSYDVEKSSCGELFYVQIDAYNRRIHKKQLCNIVDIKTRIFQSNGRKVREVLQISWYGNQEGAYFRISDAEISSKKVCKVLKTRGVCFQVSRRCEAEVMDVFLIFLLNDAKIIEIPSRRGWNRMMDGSLHFAKGNEITMAEVWENAK